MGGTSVAQQDGEESNNVTVHIREGAGGEEAARFAGALAAMYEAYALRSGWSVECVETRLDAGSSTRLGFVLEIKGLTAGKRLGFETGVHRLQRVPAYERHGRVHTSTALVIVEDGKEYDSHMPQESSYDRLEKIRTYNLPSNRVTDHRIQLTVGDVEQVLSGDLDRIIDCLFEQA
jgi:protein subunit release factor A